VAEAHAILADIYNRFTEGFDIFALREARNLLDELARAIGLVLPATVALSIITAEQDLIGKE
jgi:hypothetical protein